MAWAVSEYLVESVKSKTLFATHYHELTQLSKKLAGIENLSLAVKERGEEIIFLHKILPGPADKSYGIQVGRLAGLPERVLSRAREVLSTLEKDQNIQETTTAVKPAKKETEKTNDCYPDVLEKILSLELLKMTPWMHLMSCTAFKKSFEQK